MMTPRRVVGLMIGALVIVAVAFWLASRGHRSDAAVAGQPVLEGLKASVNDVTEVRIAKGDGTHVTLRKQPTSWEVVEREYRADSGKVRKLLIDLGALEVVEEKTSDPASYERIGVEDVKSAKSGGTRVEAVTPKKVYGLIVGRFSGMAATYVRVADAAKSYLAKPQIMLDASPKQWLEHEVLDIPESRIKEVAVTPASGPSYTVSREKKEQTDFTVSTLPKGRELSSPSAGNTVAGELASFTLDDLRKAPADGAASVAAAATPAAPGATAKSAAAKPAAESATFHTFDGLELEVRGQKDGDHHYVSIMPRSTAKETATEAQTLEARVKGWQYEIPGYRYDALFKPLEDLLKKPEPKENQKGTRKPAAKAAPPPNAS